jgi:hypothetical protein
MIIDIPHRLGRTEAKRRMSAHIGDLASRIPGGAATVISSWPTEHRLQVDVTAFQQHIASFVDVGDDALRVEIRLPGLMALMAGPIAAVVRERGENLLRDDRSDRQASGQAEDVADDADRSAK